MAAEDLTTEEGMRAWLRSNFDPSCSSVERLPEGFGGFVYRVKLDSNPKGLKSVIAKHAESYAARASSWKMNQDRMNYEYKAQTYIPTLSISTSLPIRVPEIIHHDPSSHVLIMEDAGALPSLKGWLQPDASPETTRQIGVALGEFLASFHDETARDPAILREFEGNETAKYVSAAVYYGNLPAAAEKLGYSDGFISRAAETGAREVWEAREVLTLGDFWTGNVLVSASGQRLGERGGDDRGVELFLLDLELAKPGTAAFDVGQMAAEMYCLAAFRDRKRGMGLLESFLRAYKARRRDEISAPKVAIRIGAHLVAMAPSAWRNEGSEEQIKRLVAVGVDLIRMGESGDVAGLGGSIVGPLLA